MLALLDWIYGPTGYGDPYYLLMRDFIMLMPWWYGYFWLSVIGSVFAYRKTRKVMARRATKKRAEGIAVRTRRIMKTQRVLDQIRHMRRRPCNDNTALEVGAVMTG